MSPLPDPAMADMPARSATAHNTGLNTGLNTPRQRAAWLLLGLMALSVLLAGLGASVGSTGFDSVLRLADDPMAARIVWDIRLPRSLGGLAGRRAAGLVGGRGARPVPQPAG